MVSFLVCSPGDLDQISSGAQMSQLEHRDLLSLFVHQCDRADRANSINTEKLSKQEEDISSANQILLVKMNSVEFSMTSSKINGNQEIVFNGNCFTNVERTLIHFVCSLPYVSTSEDLGQEKLFVSPTDSQLAHKLALNDRKLQQIALKPKISELQQFSVSNEDSNSVLFVDTADNKSEVTFLEQMFKENLDEPDSQAFKSFLSENNKYDIMEALDLFVQKLEFLEASGHDVLFALECADVECNLHPLEIVILNKIRQKFDLKCADGSTDFDLKSAAEENRITFLKELPENHLSLFSAWAAYLTLLVNSRCELSLARTLNVPDRELESAVFKALKKSSLEKEMPMFQTALSLITQVRLGGKGYRPSSKSSIFQHMKGLAEYVDFVDRLRAHLEDYSLSPKIAIKRVLQTLQKEFCSCKRSQEHKPFVECVYNELWQCLKEVCAIDLSAPSPKTPNSGGTLAGREAFKLLHKMVIKLNVIHSIRSVTNLNFSSEKLNHTPILNAFKSPAVGLTFERVISDCVVEVEVAKDPKTPLKQSRKSQEMNWAKTPETPFFGAKDMEFLEDESSRCSAMFAGEDNESCIDQSQHEKTIVAEEFDFEEDKIAKFKQNLKASKNTENEKMEVKKEVKRKIHEEENAIDKKTLIEKPSKSKRQKSDPKEQPKEQKQIKNKVVKKTVERVKGQRTLGMFFKQ